ncbi:hypothetical protein TNCV_1485061 [Trichonephila clavipes]|nr:hypothetical protein TNCV_1485061 [Trichonephila clavipes]
MAPQDVFYPPSLYTAFRDTLYKQGSLINQTITKMQNFYINAIKDKVPGTKKIRTAIYAILVHEREIILAKCKRVIAKNETSGSHRSMKTRLLLQIIEKSTPIFQHSTLGGLKSGKLKTLIRVCLSVSLDIVQRKLLFQKEG